MHIRVMTYNIKSGRYRPGSLEAVASIVSAQAPDFLALQEVDEGLARTGRVSQCDWLARTLRLRGLYAPAMPFEDGWYGIALLSRLPLQSHERRLLFRPAYADAAQRPRHDSEQRVALGALLALPASVRSGEPTEGHSSLPARAPVQRAGSLKVVVAHLGLTADQRYEQARELVEFAQTWQGGAPALIAGDFNCEPTAPELAPLRERFAEAYALVHFDGDARCTFPSGPPGARTHDGWRGAIDQVWLSPGVQVRSARVVHDETLASDHQPLLVDCEIC